MSDEPKPAQPSPALEKDELQDNELEEVTGGADSAGKKYQNQMQTVTNYWSVISNVLKGKSDTQKGISENIR